MQLIFLLPGCW